MGFLFSTSEFIHTVVSGMLRQLEKSDGFGFPVILPCSCFSFFHFMRESAPAHMLGCGGRSDLVLSIMWVMRIRLGARALLLPQASLQLFIFSELILEVE